MSSTTRPDRLRWLRPRSLALRLTLWYVGSSFVILLVATVALYLILVGSIHREQDQFLSDKLRVVREMLIKHPDDDATLREEVEQTFAPRQYARVFTRVVDDDGHLIAESPRMSERLPTELFPPPVPLGSNPTIGQSLRGLKGRPVRVLSARAQVGRDAEQTAIIQVALDTRLARELLSEYRTTLLLVLGGGLAFFGFAGYWVAWAGLRPLRRITAATGRIRSTSLDQRIDDRALPAELSSLVLRFNEMLGRLQEAFGRLSRFSADIAHDLRTPVNNMRLEVEVALGRARSLEEYRETLGSCLEECGRLTRIIDTMLFLARAEDPRMQIAKEAVDVGRELERVHEYFDLPAAEAGVELNVSCAPETDATLDRTLFQRAISNLIGNALRYTPRGGRITVAACRENGEVRVDVIDTGCGIPADDMPHIFDRFYRAERSRSTASGNAGLGLAIVKSIVSLHGGSIAAESAADRGTRMTIRIPAGNGKSDARN